MALEEYQQQAQLHQDARAGGQGRGAQGPRALLLRAEASRQPPPLRLPPRAQRRAAVVGRAEGPVARSEDQAARHARRGSSVRVRRVRRRDPRRLRRRHRDAVGPRHVDAGSRRRRCRAEEGRPEVHAERLQAEGIVGAGPRPAAAIGGAAASGARRRAQLAADQAPRRVGRRARHHRVRAAEREERRRLRGHPRRGHAGGLAVEPAGRRAARPARCSRRSSSARRS